MINQKELSTRVRSNLNYKYKTVDIDQIIRSAVDVILDAAANGEDTSVHGLGKFYARFIKGKTISKTGIAWLKDKEFIIRNRYHLGFSPSDSANRVVGKLIEKIDHSEEKK
jgi:nucleoid DNA-binding protein